MPLLDKKTQIIELTNELIVTIAQKYNMSLYLNSQRNLRRSKLKEQKALHIYFQSRNE